MGGSQLRGARSDQTTRPVKSNPGEEATTNHGWEHPGKDREEVNQNSNHGENWKTQPSWEPQTFPRGTAPTGSDCNTDRSRGGRKANSQIETAQKRLNSTGTEWIRHIRPGERKRSPGADPSDDPPTRKRDEWKASTRTEGDSKAPSAITATSTCCKAGARGKHTRNIVTTLGSVRGEEKSLEPAPGNRPKERMGPQDTCLPCPPLPEQRQGNPKAERGNNPMGRSPPAPCPLTPEWLRPQRERKREKTGGKLPSRRTN